MNFTNLGKKVGGFSDTLLKTAFSSADTAAKKVSANIASTAGKSFADDIAKKVALAAASKVDDALKAAGKAAADVADDIAKKAGKIATESVDDIAKKAGKAATESVDDIAKKAGKAVTESADDIAKKAGKAATESADDIAKKAGKAATESADDIAKKAGKAATESADDIAKKAGKAATESADDIAKKAGKAGAESADDIAKKVGKAGAESVDDVAKAGSSLGKKLKKGALVVGGLTALGLTAFQAERVMRLSEEEFKKRNEKQFQVTKVTSTTTEMTITFDNPENLKIYPEEIVELMNVFPQVNDKYTVIELVDNTTVTVVYAKPVYNNSDIKAGTMKLYAEQTNDANEILKEDLKTVVDVVGGALKSGLCTTISTLGLTPYVGYAVDGAYWVFFIIILMILMKFLQLVSLLLGEHIAVKLVFGVFTLGILYGVHVYAGPYFVLKC